jgi:hypothetical protein
MSKKVKKVIGDATRTSNQSMYGEFYSKHSEDDIQEWLGAKGLNYDWCEVDNVFRDNDYVSDWEEIDHEMEGCEISFEEHSEKESSPQGEVPVECRHDEEIQKFIDERPKRIRENQINTLTRQSVSLVNEFESLKSSVKENFESLKKLDFENLSEDEKTTYFNLKKIFIKLTWSDISNSLKKGV